MTLIQDITYKMGVRDTADRNSTTIDPMQPFQIGKEIYRLEPQKHQLLAWVMKNSRTKPTDTHIFGHNEKAPLPTFVTFDGDDESSQQTTGLGFTNGNSRLTKASRIYNTRTGEIIRLTADMSSNDTVAVVRNFGTSGTPLLKSGDKFKILPNAQIEGFTMGEGNTGGDVYLSFTTSIIDWPVQLTNTKAASRFINGDPFTAALADTWEQVQDQMEAELLFGGTVTDDSTYTYPLHTTKGLSSWISTNVYALDGTMSRMDFWDILAEWKVYNKGGGGIICSGQFISLVNTWAFSKVIYNQDLKSDGINIQTVTTPSGTFDLVESDLLGADPYLQGTIMLLPTAGRNQGIDYRPLIGNGINRDIAYKPIMRDEVDMKEGQILGEIGYEFYGEERFAMITGLEF